jgi:hypothetical protein
LRGHAFQLLVFLSFLFAAAALPAPRAEAASYEELLAEAKRDVEDADWTALRFAYADSPGFDLLGAKTMMFQTAMFKALADENYKEAAKQAGLLLDQSYINLDAHLVAGAAYDKLGDEKKSKLHRTAGQGIFNSIATGDGTSPEKAFTVITVGEEYAMLRALGLQPQQQSLFSDGGHSYDVLTAVNPHGKTFNVYFQIDRVVQAEQELLKGR